MDKGPWWTPTEDDLLWDTPLPSLVIFDVDYGADLPLWGDGFGNIAWQFTKLTPALLDRLAAWQALFDTNHHYERGWSSEEARSEWEAQRPDLLVALRRELAGRGVEVIDHWTWTSRAETPTPKQGRNIVSLQEYERLLRERASQT